MRVHFRNLRRGTTKGANCLTPRRQKCKLPGECSTVPEDNSPGRGAQVESTRRAVTCRPSQRRNVASRVGIGQRGITVRGTSRPTFEIPEARGWLKIPVALQRGTNALCDKRRRCLEGRGSGEPLGSTANAYVRSVHNWVSAFCCSRITGGVGEEDDDRTPFLTAAFDRGYTKAKR